MYIRVTDEEGVKPIFFLCIVSKGDMVQNEHFVKSFG